jgi:aspartate 1-decarboxylase
MRVMLKGKIHRATVTDANLAYEGSITIDPDLLDAAGMLPYEQVHVFDINNGERLVTYIIEGERGKGEMVINGAAARRVAVGDKVIVVTYETMDGEAARTHKPRVVRVDEQNRPLR